MPYHNLSHQAVAKEVAPDALRPALLNRLGKLTPEWHAWNNGPIPPPPFLELMVGRDEALPLNHVVSWARLFEWSPGHLFAVRVRYSDGCTAVVFWIGDLRDSYGDRVVHLVELECCPTTGRLLP